MVRIAAGLAVVLFGVLIWYAFDQKEESLRTAPPPLITADNKPFKVPPEDPGGMPVPHRDKTVYNALAGKKTPEVERLLPAPDEPRLPESDEAPAVPAPTEAPVSAPAPAAAPTQGTAARQAAEPAAPRATAPAAAESQAPAVGDKAPQPAKQAPAVAQPAPAQGGETATAAAPRQPEPAGKAQAEKAGEAASPPLKQVYTAADIADSIDGYKVQLGAFRDREAARQGWETVRTRHKDLVAGLRPAIVKAEVKGKGTFYRLQAGPLKDGKAARTLCDKFKSRRLGCFPVAP